MAPPLLQLKDIALTFGGTPLLTGAELSVSTGERVSLVGRNGSGKSTLLKIAAGLVEPDRGSVFVQPGALVRYLQQEPNFSGFASTLAYVEAGLRPNDSPHTARHLLEQLGLTGQEDTAHLSGGEARRASLARVLAPSPDILLLDEPTNHLDLDMRHALTKALAEYEGSMVLVSHDRALLRTVCDAFLLVVDGRAEEFDGDLDDYLAWLAARRSKQAAGNTDASQATEKVSRKEERQMAAQERQAKSGRRRSLAKEAEKLERQIAAWQKEKHGLDAQLADPAIYAGADAAKLKEVTLRQKELARLIEQSEQRWLEVHAALEEMSEA